MMALHQAAHHLRFARRAERRTGLLGFLHGDQPIDDLAAFDQERMHIGVDAIDLATQIGKGRLGLARRFRHRVKSCFGSI